MEIVGDSIQFMLVLATLLGWSQGIWASFTHETSGRGSNKHCTSIARCMAIGISICTITYGLREPLRDHYARSYTRKVQSHARFGMYVRPQVHDQSVGKGFCNKTNVYRIMDGFVKQPNRIEGILVDRGAAKLPDLRIPDVHSIKADAETRSRCVEAGKINRTIMNEAGVHGFVDTEVVDTVPAYRQVAA